METDTQLDPFRPFRFRGPASPAANLSDPRAPDRRGPARERHPIGRAFVGREPVGRVLVRCHRTLEDTGEAVDPELAQAAKALSWVSDLCEAIDEIRRRVAAVVVGLEDLVEPQWRAPNGLDRLKEALRFVEHEGRVRLAMSAHRTAAPLPSRRL